MGVDIDAHVFVQLGAVATQADVKATGVTAVEHQRLAEQFGHAVVSQLQLFVAQL